jgi:hypothetical protein
MDRDPEIFAGMAAEEYQPDIEPPHIPDYSALKTNKKTKHLFAAHRFVPYPATLYHPTLPSVVVRNKSEHDAYLEMGEWRATPYNVKVPAHGPGKTVVSSNGPSQGGSTAELMAAILEQVRRQGASASTAPAMKQALHADPEYAEFLEFKKWKEGQAKPAAVHAEPAPQDALPEADQKAILVDAAKEKGIKVDGRWSLDKIKEALDKAAA